VSQLHARGSLFTQTALSSLKYNDFLEFVDYWKLDLKEWDYYI